MWNPLLELFCYVQNGLYMETLVDEIPTARVALSCHFALDSFFDKSNRCSFLQKRLPWKLSLSLWHICGCTICAFADRFGWRTLWHTSSTTLVARKSQSNHRSVSSDLTENECHLFLVIIRRHIRNESLSKMTKRGSRWREVTCLRHCLSELPFREFEKMKHCMNFIRIRTRCTVLLLMTSSHKHGLIMADLPSHSLWETQVQTLNFSTCLRTSVAHSSTI